MRFDTSQNMRMGQQMRLAPRMIQSMEILTLPALALEERIEQELENNATLELVGPEGDDSPPQPGQQDAPSRPASETPLDAGDASGEHDFARLDEMESTYGEAFENEYSAARANRFEDESQPRQRTTRLDGERDAKMDAMANAAARGESLGEQLRRQWSLADVPDDVRNAGDLILSLTDSDGYVRLTLDEIAARAPAGESAPAVELLERALKELQRTLEPAGLCARDVRECLLLQIDALESEQPADQPAEPWATERDLIANHFDDLVANRLPKIAEKTGLSFEQIRRALERMQRLDLAPGRRLAQAEPAIIVPDAVVEYDEEHDVYIPRLNDNRLPQVRINPEYMQMARDRGLDASTRDFIRTNLRNAQWLIDAVGQRNHTLLRVLNVVVAAQREFFDYGPQALKPLPMTQVAEQLGIHVATVSRAVSGKHIDTPRGVFPLRQFFSGGTQTDSGEEVSWDAIKAALKEVVDAEDKTNPLSDDALADALKARGVEIARRTVAKYRAQLEIPSARMRKRFE